MLRPAAPAPQLAKPGWPPYLSGALTRLAALAASLALAITATVALAESVPPAEVDPLAGLQLPPDPDPPSLAMFGGAEAFPRGRAAHIDLITREAAANDLPVEIADTVAMVESAYNPAAIGGVGEIGLMQVLPSTASMLGFRGTLAELAVPATNIRYGVMYLAQAWRLADGDLCRALMKYRAGHGEERMSLRSVTYCIRARNHLASIGSPYAKAPVPEAVAIAGVDTSSGVHASGSQAARGLSRRAALPRSVRAAAPMRRSIWAESNKRIKAIESKVTSSTLTIMR